MVGEIGLLVTPLESSFPGTLVRSVDETGEKLATRSDTPEFQL